MANDAIEIARTRELLRSGRAQAILKRAAVSQSEVARDLHVGEATVSRWMSGKRTPRAEDAKRLGRLLADLAKVAP